MKKIIIILVCFLLLIVSCKTKENKAAELIALIDNLPASVAELKEEDLNNIKSMYDSLDEKTKEDVTNWVKYLDLEKEYNNYKKVKAVEKILGDLPLAKDLTLDDEDSIATARAEFDALEVDLKEKVDLNLVTNLNDCITKLESLKAEKAREDELYNSLNNLYQASLNNTLDLSEEESFLSLKEDVVSYSWSADMISSIEAYFASKKQEQELIDKATPVIELIDALPEIKDLTVDNKKELRTARSRYNSLSYQVKAYVSNYEKLVELEERMKELEEIEKEKAKAAAFDQKVLSLPSLEILSFDDLDSVYALSDEYDALDENVKAYVETKYILDSYLEQAVIIAANHEYRVYFYLNGGTLTGASFDGEAYYIDFKGEVSLPNPEREGYIFNGWFDNESLRGELITKVGDAITVYASFMVDTSAIATLDVLNCISDVVESDTMDALILTNADANFVWESSNPNLYTIDGAYGHTNKQYQTHKKQYVTISVEINYFDGTSTSLYKEVTINPVLYKDFTSTPIATYFYTGAASSYKRYNTRYIADGSMFSEDSKETLEILYYSFIVPSSDGTVSIQSTAYLDTVRELKNHDVRIIACVNGVGSDTSKAFYDYGNNATLRAKFIKNLVDLVINYNFDGVDIDWEYVSSSYPVNASAMNLIIKEVREALDAACDAGGSPYFLSSAIPASSWALVSDRYDMPTLNKYLDYINIMSYDLNNSSKATHLAPHYSSTVDNGYGFGAFWGVSKIVSMGFPASKLLIGCAGYGKAYKLTGSYSNATYPGLGASAKLIQISGLDGSFSSGTLYGNAIAVLEARSGYKKYTEMSGGHVVGSYLFNASEQIFVTYDSKEAVTAKYEYADTIAGFGLMCWSYTEDPADCVINAITAAKKGA